MNFQTIIMAGGEGKRMCSSIPKVLHKVGNKTMLEHIVEKVSSMNCSYCMVVSGRYIEQFRSVLGGMNIEHRTSIHYVEQIPPRGTGDAVRCCLPHLKPDLPVLIINGDTPLIDTCLGTFITYPKPCLMITELENPAGQGRIVTDATTGHFIRIIEERDADVATKEIKLVNCGVYWLTPDDLHRTIPHLKNNNAQGEYYLTDICEQLANTLSLYVVPPQLQYELHNVNTPNDLVYVNGFMG